MSTKSTGGKRVIDNIGDIGRQGDLYIQRIDTIPSEAKTSEAKDATVLAYGESGTHHHEVIGECVVLERPSAEALVTDADRLDLRERFLNVEKEVTLRIAHDERRHEPITLKPGKYRTWIQREWQPEAIQRVCD